MMRQDRGNNVENPPPGTILDHTVTRYEFKDFFLVPQAVNQVTKVSIFSTRVHLGNFLQSSVAFSECKKIIWIQG